jgi:hypothetical protein
MLMPQLCSPHDDDVVVAVTRCDVLTSCDVSRCTHRQPGSVVFVKLEVTVGETGLFHNTCRAEQARHFIAIANVVPQRQIQSVRFWDVP